MATDVFELVGTAIEGKYRIDRAIGEGGFGVVYRGHHLGFDSPIAVKCLKMPPHFTAEAQNVFFSRFREEGKLLLKLSGEHLAILRVFDFGVTVCRGNQVPYLVMEWLEGHDLEHHLRDRREAGQAPFNEVEALQLLRPAIEALAVAHKAGIAHRDIKPENLFLAQTDRGVVVKVLDFGIAKVMQDGETAAQLGTRTSSGFRAFSPVHGAPEQFSTKRYGPTGPWTDVHALGLILVQMVTGRPPIGGDEIVDIAAEVTADRRPTPRKFGGVVSDAFEVLCEKALALAARDRFASAEELLMETNRLLFGAPPANWGSAAAVDPGSAGREARQVHTPPGPGSSLGGVAHDAAGRGATEVAAVEPLATIAAAGPSPLAFPPVPHASPARRSFPTLWVALVALLALGGGVALWARPKTVIGDSKPEPSTEAKPEVVVAIAARSAESAEPAAPKMVALPTGTFMMGSAEGAPDEKPVHAVTLAAFELDATEVTVRDYKACVDTAACKEPDIGVDCNWGKRERSEHPINCVSWSDAVAYCTFAKKRLPTEEEWEYAARGTAGLRYPWGNAPPAELCWKRHVGEGTCPVGAHAGSKSPLGIHDLAGNVWEWTSSRFCPYSSKQCGRDARVYRGGAWLSSSPEAMVTWGRQKDDPSSRSSVVGFRCARGN